MGLAIESKPLSKSIPNRDKYDKRQEISSLCSTKFLEPWEAAAKRYNPLSSQT
jgi:hypothetical protein